MTDPVGIIGASVPIVRETPGAPGAGGAGAAPNADFKRMLQEQIGKVNDLQRDARQAIEDMAVGRRNDVESVMIATQKADTAFKLLLQVRNKVMEAYDEVKQIRV